MSIDNIIRTIKELQDIHIYKDNTCNNSRKDKTYYISKTNPLSYIILTNKLLKIQTINILNFPNDSDHDFPSNRVIIDFLKQDKKVGTRGTKKSRKDKNQLVLVILNTANTLVL